MSKRLGELSLAALCVAGALCTLSTGCYSHQLCTELCDGNLPRELNKVSLPTYVIEPPDLLLIDAIRVIPLPPYRIEPLDTILIQVDNAKPNEPISGPYVVEPEGTVNLGFSYGSVYVADMTIEEATKAIDKHLLAIITDAKAVVALGQSRGRQQIRGEHLVRQDGTVSLGIYGSVPVAGMTLDQAKAALELHLSQFLLRPEVSVDVAAYNSKVYYVVTDGAGLGRQIFRFPILGNETVLDGLSQINGTPTVAACNRIWVARPSPDHVCCEQVMPVDLIAITEKGSTATNYQLLPGDRIYVQADGLITFDNTLAKITTPLERIFGTTILGSSALRSLGWVSTSAANSQGAGTGIIR